MMAATGGEESCVRPVTLSQREGQLAAVKAARMLEVGDLEMRKTDGDFRVDLFVAPRNFRYTRPIAFPTSQTSATGEAGAFTLRRSLQQRIVRPGCAPAR